MYNGGVNACIGQADCGKEAVVKGSEKRSSTMKRFVLAGLVSVFGFVMSANAENPVGVKLVSPYQAIDAYLKTNKFDAEAVANVTATIKDSPSGKTLDLDVLISEVIRNLNSNKEFSMGNDVWITQRKKFLESFVAITMNPSVVVSLSPQNKADLKPVWLEAIAPSTPTVTRIAYEICKTVREEDRGDFKKAARPFDVNPVKNDFLFDCAFAGVVCYWTPQGTFMPVKESLGKITTDSILKLLVAPEFSVNQAELDFYKAELKERGVVGARRTLRKEGKSFVSYSVVTTNEGKVVTTVVNPIDTVVKPVVDALNAAEFAGIEAAYKGLGIDIAALDRSGLKNATVVSVKEQIMDGTLIGTENPNYFPKLVIMLGVDGFNNFVELYNTGNGARSVKVNKVK